MIRGTDANGGTAGGESTAEEIVPRDAARGRVAVASDGSVHASQAALYAATEAVARGTALTIMYAAWICDDPFYPHRPFEDAHQRRAEGRLVLDREVERIAARFPDLQIETLLYDVSPASALATLSYEAALLVLGARGRGGFAGMLVGSVSSRLAAHAHCPLVIVRSGFDATTRNELVLGLGAKPSPAASRFAFETARRDDLDVLAVRGWWPATLHGGAFEPKATHLAQELDLLRQAALAEAKAAIAPLEGEFPDVTVRLEIREDNAVPALINAARGSRLLVAGAHRKRGPLSAGAGYVVDGVLAHSSAPVAIVPEQ